MQEMVVGTLRWLHRAVGSDLTKANDALLPCSSIANQTFTPFQKHCYIARKQQLRMNKKPGKTPFLSPVHLQTVIL